MNHEADVNMPNETDLDSIETALGAYVLHLQEREENERRRRITVSYHGPLIYPKIGPCPR